MTKGAAIQYVIVCLICAVSLLCSVYNIRKYNKPSKSLNYLRVSVIFAVASALIGIISPLREAGILNLGIDASYFCTSTFLICNIMCGLMWFWASETAQKNWTSSTLNRRLLLSLPFIVVCLLIATSKYHHLIFYFDDGHYCRGPLLTRLTFICLLYIAVSGLSAFIQSFAKKNYIPRKLYRTLSIYSLGIVASQVLEIIFGRYIFPIRIVAFAIIYFIISERTLKASISIDTMTGVNNRNALERYLHRDFDNCIDTSFFLILDINDFKQINDKHGHLAGDRAIEIVSKAIKLSVPPKYYLARYGGDEFVILGRAESDEVIESMLSQIRIKISQEVLDTHFPCNITFCSGHAYVTGDIKTIPDLIDKADQELYKNKKSR